MTKLATTRSSADCAYNPALDIYLDYELHDVIGCRGMIPLRVRDITHAGDLVALSEEDLLAFGDLRPRQVAQIKDWVSSKGLALGEPDHAWLQMIKEARARISAIPQGEKFSQENAGAEAVKRQHRRRVRRYIQLKRAESASHR